MNRHVGVQQQRGVALPAGARSVARPSRFGNPFRCDLHNPAARAEAVQRFREWLDGAHPKVRGPGRAALTGPETKAVGMRALAGYDLACYCPVDDVPCHRDVWLALLVDEQSADRANTCLTHCAEHPEHVYILCYGQPTYVSDRDYLISDRVYDYPITHYVGYTRQQPPVKRIWSHGARSAHYVAQIRPGTEDDEEAAKRGEACPTCGGSLWYFGESPTYRRRRGGPTQRRR